MPWDARRETAVVSRAILNTSDCQKHIGRPTAPCPRIEGLGRETAHFKWAINGLPLPRFPYWERTPSGVKKLVGRRSSASKLRRGASRVGFGVSAGAGPAAQTRSVGVAAYVGPWRSRGGPIMPRPRERSGKGSQLFGAHFRCHTSTVWLAFEESLRARGLELPGWGLVASCSSRPLQSLRQWIAAAAAGSSPPAGRSPSSSSSPLFVVFRLISAILSAPGRGTPSAVVLLFPSKLLRRFPEWDLEFCLSRRAPSSRFLRHLVHNPRYFTFLQLLLTDRHGGTVVHEGAPGFQIDTE